ncbi:hypothetical protein CH252_01810 [Rhodococcus sp. 06-1477-1B]|nr:hypothetical protein CH252_01810 [Rhodococcus sp. 06-1477-1B]
MVIDSRRRVLSSLLAVQLVLYSAAFIASWADTNGAGAVGEMWAAVVAAVGFVAILSRRPGPVRQGIAIACAALAPALTMLTHQNLAAQVWALIPAMFLALYLRATYPVVVARVLCVALALLSATALLLAPAPAPMLWGALYVVCILAAAEVFGALGAALIAGALRDPLTGVFNRAGAVDAATNLAARAARRSENIAAIVFDVDHFKAVNDRDGHAAGDRILIGLADTLTEKVPAGSVIARLGGDEFIVLVAGLDAVQIDALAQELVAGHVVSVTYGIAVGSPGPDVLEALTQVADADMYRRKMLRRKH